MSAITAGNLNEELQVHLPCLTESQAAMNYKQRSRMNFQTARIEQTVDKSKIGKPVPVEEQLPGFYYCDKCGKHFRSKGYFRNHVRRLCPALTNPEVLSCPFCEKLYRHEQNYKAHLFIHDGIKRFHCKLCQEDFSSQGQLEKHRKSCPQRSR